jgi:choline dehydrogenase-like flavoprotein
MKTNSTYRASMPSILSCEVLIIGSGVGGSTLAHELVNASVDTLMIDEGPFIDNIYQRPQHKNFSEVWRNGGLTVAMGKPPVAYAEGCCIGGGSEINSGIFQYAPDHLLDEWAKKFDIEAFSAAELKQYYEKSEAMINANYLELKLDSLLLKKAAEKLGWKAKALKVAQKNNIKQSMCETLLPIAIEKGLRLISQCKAEKFIFKKDIITEVGATATDHTDTYHSIIIKPKYIYVCAGAIYTPHLLLKNGIKKNIGQSLQMHPTIKTLCQFAEPVSSDPSPVPSYAITEFMPDIRLGGSVMSQNFVAMSVAEDWRNRNCLLNSLDYCGVYYAMIRPEGKGKVSAIPGCKDPFVSYKLTSNDWLKIFKGLDYLQQAMFAAGAKIVFPSVVGHAGWKEKTSLDELEVIQRKRINLMTIHLFSSCPMGEDRTSCAVDSFGKVHGYKNLYISDASIIPEALGTNPQGTIMALTLRNAEHFINNIHGRIS